MARISQTAVARAPRVKLAGTVLSILGLENGRQLRGKLHTLSVTGGLLLLEKPLDEGIKVEVIFHVGQSTVRSKARLLFPMWATQGCLQPFEFIDLGEKMSEGLASEVSKLLRSLTRGKVEQEGPALTEATTPESVSFDAETPITAELPVDEGPADDGIGEASQEPCEAAPADRADSQASGSA